MPKLQLSRKYKTIPVKLTENQFERFILPHLSRGKRGPKLKLTLYKIFGYIWQILYTGMQWCSLLIEKNAEGKPEIHYSSLHRQYSRWAKDGSLTMVFESSVERLAKNDLLDISIMHGDGSNTIAKKGGDNIGYSGHKHHQGEKVVAIVDRHANILAPFITAPANRHETVLFPAALTALERILRKCNLSCKNSIMSLDSAYDSVRNRKLIFNHHMMPNIKENLRNRKKTKPGPKRIFSEAIYQERFETVERAFAWEDKFKRLLLRFERYSINHLGMKLIAYTMINLRHFCVA